MRGGDPADPLIGATLGDRFQIAARMSSGQSGAIYRAIDLVSGRGVTLRLLPPAAAADPTIVARFRQDGAALTTLRDPHTLTVYELGEAPGLLYIVMELLLGENLDDALRRNGGPLPWRRVAAIARGVCSSLAEAHGRAMMHGDIRPSNIFVQNRDGADIVKVTELGIARILNATHPSAGPFDATYDLYGLGLVMYDLIAPGRSPNGATPAPLIQRAQIPPELDHVVNRCTARDPQARFRSAAEVAAELDRVLAVVHDQVRHTPRPISEAETAIGIGAPRPKSPSATPVPAGMPPSYSASPASTPVPAAPRGARPSERTPRPKWGVAYEQLSMPDPHYTDHARPQPLARPAAHAAHAVYSAPSAPAAYPAPAEHAPLAPPAMSAVPAQPRSNRRLLVILAILIPWAIVATAFALLR